MLKANVLSNVVEKSNIKEKLNSALNDSAEVWTNGTKFTMNFLER